LRLPFDALLMKGWREKEKKRGRERERERLCECQREREKERNGESQFICMFSIDDVQSLVLNFK
jgi:hypothetical protein